MRPIAPILFLLLALTPEAHAQLPWADPGQRIPGWQADLDSALTAFLPRDRSFSPEERAKFEQDVRALRDSAAVRTDEQMIVGLATAMAGAHNAHTRLYLLRNRTVLRRYPIRVWWFGGELCVVRAHPEHADLLGGRVLTIAGRPVSEVAERVAPLYAANRSWARYMSAYLLTSPEILKGVGVIPAGDELEITVAPRKGAQRSVRLSPMALERSDQPFEASWDLAPTHPGRQGPWVSALPDTSRLPLYLRHLSRWYWTERIDGGRTLYVQYNRSQDQPGAETVQAFGKRLLAELQRDPPRKLVMDLRFNTGGNLELADSLLRAMAALPLAHERGRLFVITGRATFSAGITAVATLRQLTKAVIVGEPVGDELEMWSEGGNYVLPNTQLTLHYTNGFHSYTPVEHPEFKPYRYPDLSVTEVGPDVPVEASLAQYLSGKDPAMEAILKFRP